MYSRTRWTLGRRTVHAALGIAFAWLGIGEVDHGPRLFAQQSVLDGGTAEQWVAKLGDASYSTRQQAFERLMAMGADAIPIVEQSLKGADPDLCERLVRVLSELAVDPHIEPGPTALASLRRIALSPISLHGTLAKRSIESLELQQRDLVLFELIQMGATMGIGQVQVLTTNNPNVEWLRIGEEFRGDARDLNRLQWMQGVELLILEGPQVNSQWLEHASHTPGLKMLQVKRANIANDDLKALSNVRRLDILEFINTPIDDGALPHLKTVSVWSAMRFFGTKISLEGFQELKQSLDDIEMIYGKGGYLGVQVVNQATVEILPSRGGAAEAAGLLPHDELMAVNGAMLSSFEDLRKELSKYGPGETVDITFRRIDNQFQPIELTLKVVLGEQK